MLFGRLGLSAILTRGSRMHPTRAGIYHIEPAAGPRRPAAERRRLASDLSRLAGPEAVFWRDAELLPYDTDGMVVEKFWPDLVVLPGDVRAVAAVLRYASERGLPVTTRGAGTGLAGGALAASGGIVLVLSRLGRILEIDPVDRVAVVEPGVPNLELSAAAEPYGLAFAPDPSSQMASTLGGNFSTNAGGPHCLKYGQTHRHVLGATLILADGSAVRVGGRFPGGPAREVLAAAIGAEGTLAVAVELTLRLQRRAPCVRTFLAVFASVERASEAVSRIIASGITPAALELLDRLTIEAVEAYVRVGLPVGAGAALLIELEGEAAGMDRRAGEIRDACEAVGAWEFREARDEAERASLWKGRKTAFGAMGRLASGFYIMDGVVPRTRLPEMLRRTEEIAARHGVRVANVFHAGDGNLHPNVLFDVDDPDQVARGLAASEEILRACVALGGSLTGEHGVGIEKREYMPLLFSPEDLAAMRRLKEVFDPRGLLNPKKLFPTGERPWRPRAATLTEGAWW
jgi:glycolate oxidase